MLKKVVCLALPGTAPFEFGVVCEVFGIDRSDSGGPDFDFTIATADPGPVRDEPRLRHDHRARPVGRRRRRPDRGARPPHPRPVDERYLEVHARAAEARGAWVLSVCSGAFVLAQAGILDGRRATTHWMHADRLAARVPRHRGRPRRAVRAGRQGRHQRRHRRRHRRRPAHRARPSYGAAATNVIARRMVVPPQRDGGQSQYIDVAGARVPQRLASRSSPSGCSRTSTRTSPSTSWPAAPSCRRAPSPAVPRRDGHDARRLAQPPAHPARPAAARADRRRASSRSRSAPDSARPP